LVSALPSRIYMSRVACLGATSRKSKKRMSLLFLSSANPPPPKRAPVQGRYKQLVYTHDTQYRIQQLSTSLSDIGNKHITRFFRQLTLFRMRFTPQFEQHIHIINLLCDCLLRNFFSRVLDTATLEVPLYFPFTAYKQYYHLPLNSLQEKVHVPLTMALSHMASVHTLFHKETYDLYTNKHVLWHHLSISNWFNTHSAPPLNQPVSKLVEWFMSAANYLSILHTALNTDTSMLSDSIIRAIQNPRSTSNDFFMITENTPDQSDICDNASDTDDDDLFDPTQYLYSMPPSF